MELFEGDGEEMGAATIIGVVTVSDRASRGEYEDRGGPAVIEYLKQTVTSEIELKTVVIPDELEQIEATLVQLCDGENCSLVITTGGSGPAIRDVTPEATENGTQMTSKIKPGTSSTATFPILVDILFV